MKTINVFQCELKKSIPLEYIGKVKYIGETFGVDGLTNDKLYDIVRDKAGMLKVVDDSDEDYIYNLKEPRPADGSSKGGKFYFVDDPYNVLKKYMEIYK
ncbi:MAG: hypothetical protein PUG67_01970 [Peptoniphilaceae bacterium]|nr:hypothetical protein [Peptoniphilaceae bacterium]MDY6019195.1 hypothetical protein [Anaerococcus sp.]